MINSQPRDGQHRLRRLRRASTSSRSTTRACATCSRTRRSVDGADERRWSSSSAARRRSTWPSRCTQAGARSARRRLARRSTWPRTGDRFEDLARPPRRSRSRRARRSAPSKRRSTVAEQIGYPVLVRPSYVLGGRAMEIVHNDERPVALRRVGRDEIVRAGPILVDKYLEGREVEVDAICDGEDVADPRHHGAHRARRRPLRRQHRRLPAAQRSPSSSVDDDRRVHRRARRWASGCAGCSTSST